MRCYVINLAGSVDRLDHMSRTFGEAGIEFERFDAVGGERVYSHPIVGVLPPMKIRDRTRGEIGCLLSHYELWRRVASGDDDFAAIFEDDILVDSRLKILVSDIGQLPEDADLIKLEASDLAAYYSRNAICGPEGLCFRRLLSIQIRTGGYIISKKAARRLTRMVSDFDDRVDLILFTPQHRVGRQLKTYQVFPGVVAQNDALPSNFRLTRLTSALAIERDALEITPENLRKHHIKRFALLPFRMPGKLWRMALAVKLTVPFNPGAGHSFVRTN